MIKYVLTLIVMAICSLNTFNYLAAQEIIESSTIADVLPLIDEDTWVLVDLDNTVFQAKQALGHVNWLQTEVQKQIDAGKSREEAFHFLYPLWKKTQIMTEVIPVESDFIEAIKLLQNRNIVVMGLTHRQLFIVPETLRQLDSIGVCFQQTAPSQNTFSVFAKYPALYTHGVLFVDDFNTKGDVFRDFLQYLGQKPKKVVFIDDKKKNVEELAKAALIEEIDYVGVHYTAVEQGPQIYSPELAVIQLRFFNTIMSNEQALQLLSQEHENQEIKMIQHSTPEYLYKIVSLKEWQKSLLHNEIALSSMDKEFIHLAKEEQVVHVVQKFWGNMDYIVLKLVSKKLVGRLVYEINHGGSTQYYHLYDGNIPLDAVVDVTISRKTNKYEA
jgi:uncharacterized protein (DUF952 family)/FMN phosphatase YigB (HAD superfamily)